MQLRFRGRLSSQPKKELSGTRLSLPWKNKRICNWTRSESKLNCWRYRRRKFKKERNCRLMIYNARLSFKPNIGQTYYLYQKNDESYMLSLVSPKEWGGGSGPFKKFIAAVQLLADHTWKEL